MKCTLLSWTSNVTAVCIRDDLSMTPYRCRPHEQPGSSEQTSLVAATSQSVWLHVKSLHAARQPYMWLSAQVTGRETRVHTGCCHSAPSPKLWSHCIRIWPIFDTDIHCRQRQNKQVRLSRWRRFEWRRAVLTCTDMFRRNQIILFFPVVYASVWCSFVLSTQIPCFRLFILEENG